MRRKTRRKMSKILIIISLILVIVVLGIIIGVLIKLNKKPQISYDDKMVCKEYFKEIRVDLSNGKVYKDGKKTTLNKVYDITEEMEKLALTSEEQLRNLFSDTTVSIVVEDGIYKITDQFQTKRFIIESKGIEEKVQGENIREIQDDLYEVSFYSEKLTKAMYNYYKDKSYIKKIYLDEIYIDKPINDISQTMYRK